MVQGNFKFGPVGFLLGKVNMLSGFLDNRTAGIKSGEFLEQAGG